MIALTLVLPFVGALASRVWGGLVIPHSNAFGRSVWSLFMLLGVVAVTSGSLTLIQGALAFAIAYASACLAHMPHALWGERPALSGDTSTIVTSWLRFTPLKHDYFHAAGLAVIGLVRGLPIVVTLQPVTIISFLLLSASANVLAYALSLRHKGYDIDQPNYLEHAEWLRGALYGLAFAFLAIV